MHGRNINLILKPLIMVLNHIKNLLKKYKLIYTSSFKPFFKVHEI
jgi:hypothetical protein